MQLAEFLELLLLLLTLLVLLWRCSCWAKHLDARKRSLQRPSFKCICTPLAFALH